MPCASRAVIRALDTADLEGTGLDIAICNAFHLSIAPGEGVVARRGGLHRFMDWPGKLATDSGGYQVFSLAEAKPHPLPPLPRCAREEGVPRGKTQEAKPNRNISEQGVRIRSPKTGEWLRLTPERSLQIQNELGADLVMCFDECAPFPCEREYARASFERTLRWAERSRAAHGRTEQVLFGIVQGSVYPELRAASAEGTVALDFPAYAIGGVSVGESRAQMLEAVEACLPYLPEDRVRYVMGVGTPLDIVDCVARGVDLFDCVLPTRNARHGLIYTGAGTLRMGNAAHREDERPLEAGCPCPACRRYSRAYLHYLFRLKEAAAWRLLSLHNLTFYARLMRKLREAVREGKVGELRAEVERGIL
jgi:queuine tRNA-ribosyltransferase